MTIEFMGPYHEAESENWWLDTHPGRVVTSLITLGSLIVVAHIIAYAADVFYFRGRAR